MTYTLVCTTTGRHHEYAPVDSVDTSTVVETRITKTLVDLGCTQLIIVAVRTQAPERVDSFNASPAVQTRARLTLVDVDFTQTTCNKAKQEGKEV